MIGPALLALAFVLAVAVLGWIAANDPEQTTGHLDEQTEDWIG